MLLTVIDGNGNAQFIIPNSQATLLVDHSGTITTGGQAQKLLSANPQRSGWFVQNQHASEVLYVYEFGAPTSWVAGAGAVAVAAGATYPSGVNSSGVAIGQVDVYAATTGHPFAAREW